MCYLEIPSSDPAQRKMGREAGPQGGCHMPVTQGFLSRVSTATHVLGAGQPLTGTDSPVGAPTGAGVRRSHLEKPARPADWLSSHTPL